jgi:hypothetical protein
MPIKEPNQLPIGPKSKKKARDKGAASPFALKKYDAHFCIDATTPNQQLQARGSADLDGEFIQLPR